MHLVYFPSFQVNHVLCKANETAHGLTRLTLGVDEEPVCLEEFLLTIESVVVNDVSFL